MARRATLANEALIALGIEKLAKLVLDEAERNAPFKKMAMAALAGAKGPNAVAAIIDRRLSGLERARGFIDWERRKAFAADLRATLATITDELGPTDPGAAVDRLIRFLICAKGVFERVDDSSGYIQDIFHDAADAVPELASKMPDDDKGQLIERLIPNLASDDYGLIETVVHGLVAVLPDDALAAVDSKLAAAADESGSPNRDDVRDWERLGRRDRPIRARQAIADQAADVDSFIALASQRPTARQDTLGIAERLLMAGRAREALDWIRRPSQPGLRAMTQEDIADASAGMDLTDRSRVRLEIRILTSLGQKDAAQDLRWKMFEASLDSEILREFIAHLPDFEEFDALERAFAYAQEHPHRYRSLGFFLAWPKLILAAKLVVDHHKSWEGRHYGALAPAAKALEHDFPVAATILYRALLDDILARTKSPAYGHGARYLARLDELAAHNLVTPGLPDHDAYRAGLRKAHGRKKGFWSIVDGAR